MLRLVGARPSCVALDHVERVVDAVHVILHNLEEKLPLRTMLDLGLPTCCNVYHRVEVFDEGPFDIRHLGLFQTVDDVLFEGPCRSLLDHDKRMHLQGREHVGVILTSISARAARAGLIRCLRLADRAGDHVSNVQFVEDHSFLAARQRGLKNVEGNLDVR